MCQKLYVSPPATPVEVLFDAIFPEMDEVIRVRTMPEFVQQDCVKLIGYGVATKYKHASKPLFILDIALH